MRIVKCAGCPAAVETGTSGYEAWRLRHPTVDGVVRFDLPEVLCPSCKAPFRQELLDQIGVRRGAPIRATAR